MKEIKLTNGMIAIVDDEDFEELIKYTWGHTKSYWGNNGYVSRHEYINGKTITTSMHRHLLNPPNGMVVDHINNNGLDNRMANLRLATHADNMKNRKPFKGRKYKGTHFNKKTQKWTAQIGLNGKTKNLGVFESETEAAEAYDKAAIETGNPFYYINFPDNNT